MHALLTGGGGMLASSIAEAWASLRPDDELSVLARRDVDLRDAAATRTAIAAARPDIVIHTAAFVGGIGDKIARPLPYLLDNLRIDASLLDAVVTEDVPAYLYVASAAVYPAAVPNPISESALFEGRLEPANEGYGLAKLAGLTAVGYAARQTGRSYRAILPSNLYGPYDTFDPTRSHLVASTIYKAQAARMTGSTGVLAWGDGSARREFTYAPDLAEWIVGSIDGIDRWPAFMNIGAGVDHSIREFYEIARDIVGYDGDLLFDATRPSGVPRRLIDSTVASGFGWAPQTSIRDGMAACYAAFLSRTHNGDL